MKEININVKINNKDLPYEYKGVGTLNKDIIEFKDEDYNYIYDMTINRLTKYNKETRLIIDFNKEELIIEQDKTLAMKIKVKEKKIDEKNIKILYSIDKDDIEFSINFEEVK